MHSYLLYGRCPAGHAFLPSLRPLSGVPGSRALHPVFPALRAEEGARRMAAGSRLPVPGGFSSTTLRLSVRRCHERAGGAPRLGLRFPLLCPPRAAPLLGLPRRRAVTPSFCD